MWLLDEYKEHRKDLLAVAGLVRLQLHRFPFGMIYTPIRCTFTGPKRYVFSLFDKPRLVEYHLSGHDHCGTILPELAAPEIHPPGMYMMFVEKLGCYQKLTERKAFILLQE